MSAIFDRVLTVNLVANTVIFYVASRLYLLPLVPRVRPRQILVPILLLHSMRHLGLMFLSQGATFPGMLPHVESPEHFLDRLRVTKNFHNLFDRIPIACCRRHGEELLDLTEITDRLHLPVIQS